MKALSLTTLVLLSMLGQSFSTLMESQSAFIPLAPSKLVSSTHLSLLIEFDLYHALPNPQVLEKIPKFLKSSQHASPVASCKDLPSEHILRPVFIFVDNLQPELFNSYACDNSDIYAVVVVNKDLLIKELPEESAETDALIYLGSICHHGTYNFLNQECIDSVRKRALDLTQDQQDLYNNYIQAKANGIPAAIGLYCNDINMYKELYDQMVAELLEYVPQRFNTDYTSDMTDAVSAVGTLFTSDFATDNQVNLLKDLDGYFYLPYVGPIESLLDMYRLYLLYLRKTDQRLDKTFLYTLNEVDSRIRKKLTYYLTYSRGDSGSFTSYPDEPSMITYSYSSTENQEPESVCYCGICYNYIYIIQTTYEHISQFSDLVKYEVMVSSGMLIENYCQDLSLPLDVALYDDDSSSSWKCVDLTDSCPVLAIVNSRATYFPTGPNFSLLYNSACPMNSVLDPYSHLCCLENCGYCSNLSECDVCNVGFVLNADKTQCGCNGTAYCVECNIADNKCAKCKEGYTMDANGTCSMCGPLIGCNLCSADYTICNQCENGYFLYNNTCTLCQTANYGCKDCLMIADTTPIFTCTQCQDYFTITPNKTCEYCGGIKNCSSCDVQGTQCFECAKGFYFTNDGKCESCNFVTQGCAECGQTGQQCTSCGDMYTMQPNNSCLRCNGIKNCEVCANGGLDCNSCYWGFYLNENTCFNCSETFSNCLYCSNSECLRCSEPSALLGGRCVPGYRYLQQESIKSSFSEDFNSIIISLTRKIPISNDCSIILNSEVLGLNPICSFLNPYQFKIVLGSGWSITSTTFLKLDPLTLTEDGDYYALPANELLAYPMNNLTGSVPIAIIEGPDKVARSCNKISISFSSSKSYGVAVKTFSYLWSTDIPVDFASIVDPTSPTLQIINFSYDVSFNVYLTVSNIFGASQTTAFLVYLDNTSLRISVELDIGSSIKLMYAESSAVQAKITDFCGLVGAVSYSWTLNPDVPNAKCYMNKCTVPGLQFVPGISYFLTVEVLLTTATSVYSSSASSVITSEYNSPIAIINTPSGDLNLGSFPEPRIFSFYSNSIEPNGLTSTLSWSSTIPGFEVLGSQFFIELNQMNLWFANITKFDLTLTVSNGYKTSSVTNIFKVIKGVDTRIKVWMSQSSYMKYARSAKISLWGDYTSDYSGTVSFRWFVTPMTELTLPSTNYFLIAGSKLSSGSYFFSLSITQNDLTNSAYVRIVVNAGASCPPFSVTSFPEGGAKTNSPLAFTIKNCFDLDGEDLPLKYTFGYSTSLNGRVNYLSTPSLFSQYSFKFPAGIIYGIFLVCDKLGDCSQYKSLAVIVTKDRVRNLKDSNEIYNEYKQDSQLYELPAVIDYFLENYDVPEDLIDIMWSNFTEYINYQVMNIDVFMIVESIAFQFINHQTSLTYERIESYIYFVNACLKDLDEIDSEEEFRVRELADTILDVSLEMPYVVLANTLLDTLLGLNDLPVSAASSESTQHFSLICVEDLITELRPADINFGALSIDIVDVNIPAASMLEIKAITYRLGNYSDIFSVSFNGKHELNKNSITKASFDVILQKGDVLIEVPVNENDVKCVMWVNSEWAEEECSVMEVNDGKAIVSVTKSGIFTLTTVSSQNTRIALYCVVSLIMLALILVPLLSYVDKKQLNHITEVTSRTIKEHSDTTDYNIQKIDQNDNAPLKTKYCHLLLSLLTYDERFSRSMRGFQLISNFALLIYLSNLAIAVTELNPFISGVIAAAIVIPISFIVALLLTSVKKSLQIIGTAILVTVCAVAAVGTFFLQTQPGWLYAISTAFLTEIIVSQTIVMLAIRLVR